MERTRWKVATAQRTVIKIGTRVLYAGEGRIALARLYGVIDAVAELARSGREVLVVSSGAVGLGTRALDLEDPPEDLALRQACAAVGQSRLMSLWEDGLSKHGLTAAQVLLTQSDFEHRERYLNLRRTLETLLDRSIVPIINENDVVSTEELEIERPGRRSAFGDNDRLSALVASKLDADLLVLLTDVDGVYDRPPDEPGAVKLNRVEEGDEITCAGPATSGVGRGGMRSKVEAARLASRAGCHAVVASGLDGSALGRVLDGGDDGTWFPARSGLPARRRWIAFAAASRGLLVLDDGAVEALRRSNASLLAAGVVAIEGEFSAGDVIELRDRHRTLVGRGQIRWDAATVRSWCAGSPPSGLRNAHALIRRNHLALEE